MLAVNSQQSMRANTATNWRERSVPGSRSTEGAIRTEHNASTSMSAAAYLTSRLNIVGASVIVPQSSSENPASLIEIAEARLCSFVFRICTQSFGGAVDCGFGSLSSYFGAQFTGFF